MELTGQSNHPDSEPVTIVDGSTDTGYVLLAESDFGDAVWRVAYSGPRGTQGARAAGSVPENRPLVLAVRVGGSDKDDLAGKMSVLYALMDGMRRFGGTFTWRANNQTARQHFDVMAGTASCREWGNRAETKNRATMILESQCGPYLLGDPMDIEDDFSTDTLSEYTFDAGSGTLSVSGGKLVPSDGTQKRLYHSDRGYTYSDVQVTLKYTTGASGAGDIGVIARRLDANNYLRAYSDSGNLYVQYVDGGSASNIAAAVAHTARAASTDYWIRIRCEGNVITAEHFTSEPTPMGTPATTVSGTLTGAALTEFGAGVEGQAGMIVSPAASDWRFDDFRVWPYTYRNKTLPEKLSLYGSLPGDAPPLADVRVAASGSSAPRWGLIAWAARPETSTLGHPAPFGVIEAETGQDIGTWVVTADADYRGGSGLQFTTTGTDSDANADFPLDPAVLVPDDHSQGEIDIEIWGRFELASALSSPTLTASMSGSNVVRYTNEWGSAGKSVTKPSAGTVFRLIRLGTITMPVVPSAPVAWTVNILANWGAGGSGMFGFDYLVIVPLKGRACSPTSKVQDSTYPSFIPDAQREKTVRADLSGHLVLPGFDNGAPDNGLGGSPIELPTGDVDLVVLPSNIVPDDPTVDTGNQALAYPGTVRVSPTPRYHLLRSG